MRCRSLSPFLRPQVLFTTNEPQSYVFGGRNHPLHSNSQKALLRDFAEKNGLLDYEFYVDDGYTGRNFDRPGFQRMIADIEKGRINLVITKDLSRLGRNYIMCGQYTDLIFQVLVFSFPHIWSRGPEAQQG